MWRRFNRWIHAMMNSVFYPLFTLFFMISGSLLLSESKGFAQTLTTEVSSDVNQRLAANSLKGDSVSFSDLLGKDGKAVCFAFLHPDCPLTQKYGPVLSEIATKSAPLGVKIVGVVCEYDSVKEITDYQSEFSITFPLFTDKSFHLAKALNARVTPEVVLVDSSGRVRYQGRIDDRYRVRGEKNPGNPVPELMNAISDVLAGREVKTAFTKAAGCPLDRPEAPSEKVKPKSEVTFYRDIKPFLHRNCEKCHSPENAAPFSLISYEDAVDWLALGVEEIEAHRMPPAQIETDLDFDASRPPSAEEIAMLNKWLIDGMPKGDPASSPKLTPLPDFREFDDELGPPDLILHQPVTTELGPKGKDLFRFLVFPLNSKEDTYVRAFQFLPSNRRIVHHALIAFAPHDLCNEAIKNYANYHLDIPGDKAGGYLPPKGIGFRVPLPGKDGQPKVALVGGYTPGNRTSRMPDDSAILIPAGSDIELQIHYSRTGKQESDTSRLGIWLAKKDQRIENKPLKKTQFLFMSGDFAVIPAGAKDFRVRAEYTLPCDAELIIAIPHAHNLARWIEIRYQEPGDDKIKRLLRVPRWDFNWQSTYSLKQPLSFRSGTRFEVEGSYDNSSDNPRNPNHPPKPVWHAENSNDEMLLPLMTFSAEKSFDPLNLTTQKFLNILNQSSLLKRLVEHKYKYIAAPDGTISISPNFEQ